MHRLASLLIILVLIQNVTGLQGGGNEETEFEGTGIISMEYEDFVIESSLFEIVINLDNGTADNGTSVIWVTQICINSGVCYPPQDNDMTPSEDGKNWISSVSVEEDASYVNWRVKMNWSDGEETNVPESGFGWKVWSTCWFDGVEWGGIDESCNSKKDESFIPGFEILITTSSIILASLIIRRN